jgi:acetyl-CoA acetyltransferase
MAETMTRRAAESGVSREELKEVALEAGRVPAA